LYFNIFEEVEDIEVPSQPGSDRSLGMGQNRLNPLYKFTGLDHAIIIESDNDLVIFCLFPGDIEAQIPTGSISSWNCDLVRPKQSPAILPIIDLELWMVDLN
jgi:hypothetical protein